MRNVFDDYGCLRCSARGKAYGANGMCKKCLEQVKIRCALSLKRRGLPVPKARDYHVLDPIEDAKRLLHDLLPAPRPGRPKNRSRPAILPHTEYTGEKRTSGLPFRTRMPTAAAP